PVHVPNAPEHRALTMAAAEVVDEVAAFFGDRVATGVTPGAAVMASRSGAVFMQQAWGVLADGTPCTTDMVFPFMSFSKGISATAICAVAAGGGFGWDDLVSDHLPEYGCKGKEHTTLRHLLTHAAGIPTGGLGLPLTGPGDWRSTIAGLCALPAEWEPGTRTAYHALSGVLVAAEVASRAAGQPFAELCADLVL